MNVCVCVGRASIDFGAIFSGFLSEIQGTITSLGQHILNQGLSAVIGGLGSLGGSRAIGDIFACKSRSISVGSRLDLSMCSSIVSTNRCCSDGCPRCSVRCFDELVEPWLHPCRCLETTLRTTSRTTGWSWFERSWLHLGNHQQPSRFNHR